MGDEARSSSQEDPSRCRNHPDRPASFVCRKYGFAYCDECCACSHLHTYCEHRGQCLISELCREAGGYAGDV